MSRELKNLKRTKSWKSSKFDTEFAFVNLNQEFSENRLDSRKTELSPLTHTWAPPPPSDVQIPVDAPPSPYTYAHHCITPHNASPPPPTHRLFTDKNPWKYSAISMSMKNSKCERWLTRVNYGLPVNNRAGLATDAKPHGLTPLLSLQLSLITHFLPPIYHPVNPPGNRGGGGATDMGLQTLQQHYWVRGGGGKAIREVSCAWAYKKQQQLPSIVPSPELLDFTGGTWRVVRSLGPL